MANNVLGKKKKVSLPDGWIERFTKKHPDKPYYFNENTGESSWTPPVAEIEKAAEEQNGKKRKYGDNEDEPPVDPVTGPKNNDTPAMRLYREKMAQRKIAQEAERNMQKSKLNLNRTVTPQIVNGNASSTPMSSIQGSLRQSSFVPPKAKDSGSSDISTVSNASMGSIIKSLSKTRVSVESVSKTSNKETVKLPKIPKIQTVRAEISSPSDGSSGYVTMSDSRPCFENSSNSKSNFGTARKLSNKNLANERSKKFGKSLSAEKNKQVPNKLASPSVTTDFNDNDCEMLFDQKIIGNRQIKVDEEGATVEDKRLLEKTEAADDFYDEQMDWESIEDEKIIFEVNSVRNQLCVESLKELSELSCHVINSGHVPNETNAFYVIVDTNVFLSHLAFVEEVRDSHSENFGCPFIVVPWTVLQELEYIKDDRDNSRSQALKLNARKAVDFLTKHFAAKHPRFLGQTPTDVQNNKEMFPIECPDDEILQTCLQVKSSTRTTVLLSYDKNLCTKAMLHEIPTIGRDEQLKKIFFFKAAEVADFVSNSFYAHIEEKADDISITQKEMLEADDIMEEGNGIMKALLSDIVSKEMESLFGDRWEIHVIIRPPWSLVTVLKCALEHWKEAVSESFSIRKAETTLLDLLKLINNVPEGERKLQDVQQFLDKCNDVVQTLKSVKYPELKLQVLQKIEALHQRCRNVIEEVSSERFKLFIGTESDAAEEERRAFNVFRILEDLYNFSRDVCGTASEILGLQFSIQYNKNNSRVTPTIAIEQEKNVGINVNKLVQALEASLVEMDGSVQPNDRTVQALYETIVSFSADMDVNELARFTPLDVFCCLKRRRQQLEKGIDQSQELSVHFARIASKQCLS